ncbi:MAG: diguanylate cyclase, partial [Paraburkholderia tropica]
MAIPLSAASPAGIEALIAQRQLRAVFQPIVDLDDGAILGYEGLVRGPAGSPLESPAALFAEANRAGCTLA